MTCIVAMECQDGNAIIAGDYCASNGFTYYAVEQPKIFRHSGMIFGYTSTFRFGQIIEHSLDDNRLYPPEDASKTYEWLVRVFIPKLKTTLSKEDYSSGGNAIVVVNGQVWEIQNDFSVIRNSAGIASVGSGVYHATAIMIGELMDLQRKPSVEEAKNIVRKAYQVTAHCVTSVSEKHNILTYKEGK